MIRLKKQSNIKKALVLRHNRLIRRWQKIKTLLQKEREMVLNTVKYDSLVKEESDEWNRRQLLAHEDPVIVKYRYRGELFHRLRLIDESLARIETGQYGKCIDCHHKISAKSLHLDLTQPYCEKCQHKFKDGYGKLRFPPLKTANPSAKMMV